MPWSDAIAREIERGREAERIGNAGMARTCARRAAGIAIRELESRLKGKNDSKDLIQELRWVAEERGFPREVQQAAYRLQQRLNPDFTSLSKDPLFDAEIIVRFVRDELEKLQAPPPSS